MFIAHSEAQLVLERLGLPFISVDNAAPANHSELVIVDADDSDVNAAADLNAGYVLREAIAWEPGDSTGSAGSAARVPQGSVSSASHLSDEPDQRMNTRHAPHTHARFTDVDMSTGSQSRTGSSHGGLRRSPLRSLDHVDNVSEHSRSTGHATDAGMDSQSFQGYASDTQFTQAHAGAGTLVCMDDVDRVRKRTRKRWTTTTLKELRQDDYENMPPAQCVMVATRASMALQIQTDRASEAAKQCRALKRMNSRQEKLLQKRQKLLDEANHRSGLEIVSAGKTGKRMTTQSAFAVGIRRNMSNIAAADFGSTILMDMSHQRVTRSELKTCAAMLCRMKSLCSSVVGSHASSCSSHPERGLVVSGQSEWQLSTISFRCDATNSSIWRREKLHVLDVDFAWVKDFAAVRSYDGDHAIAVARCLPLGPAFELICHVSCVMHFG